MHWTLGLLVLAAVPAGESKDATSTNYYLNYTQAYHTAQTTRQPMLVVLNPGTESQADPITYEEICKTQHRRGLIQNYVVVIIDTESSHGRVVHRLFGSRKLPYVAVIDRWQRSQVFQTSETLQGQQWNRILQNFQGGELNYSFTLYPRWCAT